MKDEGTISPVIIRTEPGKIERNATLPVFRNQSCVPAFTVLIIIHRANLLQVYLFPFSLSLSLPLIKRPKGAGEIKKERKR